MRQYKMIKIKAFGIILTLKKGKQYQCNNNSL